MTIPQFLRPIDSLFSVLFSTPFITCLSIFISITLCCFILSITQLLSKRYVLHALVFLSLIYTSLMALCFLVSVFLNRIDLIWTGLAIGILGPSINTLLPHVFSQGYTQSKAPSNEPPEPLNEPLYAPIVTSESEQPAALTLDEFESGLDAFLAMHDPQKERDQA